MTTTHELTSHSQRGTLTREIVTETLTSGYAVVTGWFHIEGATVIRRKIGGRNASQFCAADRVLDFEPSPTARD